MSKRKKKNPAADDLIESLMKDLKESPDSSSDENDLFAGMLSPEEEVGAALLAPEGHELDDPPTAIGNLWSELENIPAEGSDSPDNLNLPPLPESEKHYDQAYGGRSSSEDGYQGPSAGDGGYQSPDEVFEGGDDKTRALATEDKTVSIQNDPYAATSTNATSTHAAPGSDAEKTLAVSGFANVKLGNRRPSEPDVKVSIGQLRGSSARSSNVFTNVDASLVQADNLKLAQQRLTELERELEKLRSENEELASAGDIIRTRADEYAIRLTSLEKEKREIEESHQSEVLILKGNLQYKESEVAKARIKVEELEMRLKSDFKKIRVRERELENRLELIRAEKSALVRAKDESILDLKRKIDQLQSELDNYRGKTLELNKTIDSNQEQFKRTVRALRLALSNLEVKDENVVPFKKAE
jgi:tetrahydromethanopterin S-methyltransferase subunit G